MGVQWTVRCFAGICLLVCFGCETAQHTGIILVVDSNLKIPDEITHLNVSVNGAAATAVPLGQTAGRTAFPAKIGIEGSSTPGAALSVHLSLANDHTEVLTRELKLAVDPGMVRTIPVSLNRDCAKAACTPETTCVPGWGCVRPEVDAAGKPMELPAGPPCDCNSFFPLCLGANWTSEIWLAGVRQSSKSLVIANHARILDEGSGAQLNGFLLVVHDADNSRRWMARNGSQIQWRRDYRFDSSWRLTRDPAYFPAKLRLDESRTTIGETWDADYVLDSGMPGQARYSCRHKDRWEVVNPATVQDAPTRFGPLLCHHRVDGVADEDRDRPECQVPVDDKIFCFARGVGKVLERGVQDETELLSDFTIPGCPKPQ